MFKRWWDRRSGRFSPQPEVLESDEPQYGDLVRKGRLVTLRTHVPANREAFQRWYGDREIAELLRHDLEPLNAAQSRSYFDTFILPASARGLCFAIHERKTKRLIGTTALTDRTRIRGTNEHSALFRIVIGEKDAWGKGYGTEATQLVAAEGFESLGLSEIRLEVFAYNERALAAYRKVGFEITGEHVEWVARRKTELRVIEMRLKKESFQARVERPRPPDEVTSEHRRALRQQRREVRLRRRAKRLAAREAKGQRAANLDGPAQCQAPSESTLPD